MTTKSRELLHVNLWILKEIAKLSEKIKDEHGDSNSQSWCYPSTKSSDLDIHKLLENSVNIKKSNDYTYVLELIIDRTMYNLSLILNFLEDLKDMTQFQPDKSVKRPETFSLATILYMLWERIRQFAENAKTQIPKQVQESVAVSLKTSRFTQTESTKISRCSCCEMVQQFMTLLISEIENKMKKGTSRLAQERYGK